MGWLRLLVRIGGSMNAYDYLRKKRDAILAGSDLFWLPSGMSYDNVLAAYQFVGVESENVALEDITGHGRRLTKVKQDLVPTWNKADGFTFAQRYWDVCGYLDNADLNAQTIRSAVVRFSDVTLDNRCWLITAGGSDGLAQLCAAATVYTDHVVNLGGPGYTSGAETWRYGSAPMTEGVLGANFGTADGLYINGAHAAVSSQGSCASAAGVTWHTFGNVHADMSDLSNAQHAGKCIQAAVFFSVALSADDHAEVARRIMEV